MHISTDHPIKRQFLRIFCKPSYLDGIFWCFIVAITIWGYYDTLDDFFIMDDFDLIRRFSSFNEVLRHLRYGMSNGFYRPLISLLFFWDFYWWEWNPLGYHITNLFFHTVSAFLVYGITKHLTKSSFTSLVAGVLFGLHTSHTEAVTWISGRFDVVCTAFFLLSIYHFILSAEEHLPRPSVIIKKQRTAYMLSLVFFGCALLSKEMSITLPLIIIGYDLIFSPQWTLKKDDVWKKIKRYAPYGLLLSLYFMIRFLLFHGIGGYKTRFWGTFIFKNLITYFKFLTIPFADQIFSASLTVNLVGLAVITIVCLLISKTTRFAILWIFITLIPVYSFTLGRGVYLASAGFCILAGIVLTFRIRVIPRFHEKKMVSIGLRMVQIVIISAIFYQYSIILKGSNAWWSGVAEINEQVPLMVKTIYPTFPKEARLCLQEVPLVFNQRFNTGFLIYYPDNPPKTSVKSFKSCLEDLDNDELQEMYFFDYDQEGRILYDVTTQLREWVTYHQDIDVIKLDQAPHHLSKKTPQLHLDFAFDRPFVAMGIVSSLANGAEVPQGQIIAQGRVEDDAGHVESLEIVTGQDTAEWAIRFPGIQEQVQHKMPPVYKAWAVRQSEKTFVVAQNYIKKVRFRSPFVPKEFSLEFIASPDISTNLSLDVNRILLYPEALLHD